MAYERRMNGLSSRPIAWVVLVSMMITGILSFAAPAPAVAKRKDASIVIDANTGRTLHAHLVDEQRYPASLTKIMTLYIVFEMIEAGRLTLDTELVTSKRASRQQPSKIGLKPGEKIKVRDAIAALVTKSANDVAVVVAENLGKTETKFAQYMTHRARALGMKSTTFRNASGLPNSGQVTTARDMALLGLKIIDDFPQHYANFARQRFSYKGKSYRSHNKLLRSYKGTDGIKTGYIRASGFNLVSSVRRGSKHLIGVVMGGKSGRARNREMVRILDKSWAKASGSKTRDGVKSFWVGLTQFAPTRTAAPARGFAGVARGGESGGPGRAPSARPVQPRRTVRVAKVSATTRVSGSEEPGTATASAAQRSGGPFHIQVGAYFDRSDALKRLASVQRAADGALDAHAKVTPTFQRDGRTIYRSRFAGFEKPGAQKVCRSLKRKKIACVVMVAN